MDRRVREKEVRRGKNSGSEDMSEKGAERRGRGGSESKTVGSAWNVDKAGNRRDREQEEEDDDGSNNGLQSQLQRSGKDSGKGKDNFKEKEKNQRDNIGGGVQGIAELNNLKLNQFNQNINQNNYLDVEGGGYLSEYHKKSNRNRKNGNNNGNGNGNGSGVGKIPNRRHSERVGGRNGGGDRGDDMSVVSMLESRSVMTEGHSEYGERGRGRGGGRDEDETLSLPPILPPPRLRDTDRGSGTDRDRERERRILDAKGQRADRDTDRNTDRDKGRRGHATSAPSRLRQTGQDTSSVNNSAAFESETVSTLPPPVRVSHDYTNDRMGVQILGNKGMKKVR